MNKSTYKQLSDVFTFDGFRPGEKRAGYATWVRDPHHLIRQSVGVQDSSLEKGHLIGTLSIWVRPRAWGGLDDGGKPDVFLDALTREWGKNGIFYYGWQSWQAWRETELSQLLEAFEHVALPWLNHHAIPENLMSVLADEIVNGYPSEPPNVPFWQKIVARLFLGPSATKYRLIFPLKHRELLGHLCLGLGDTGAAIRWLQDWVASFGPEWPQREKYQGRIEMLAKGHVSAT